MISELNRQDKRNFLLLLAATAFHFASLAFMFLLPGFINQIGGNENHMGFIYGIAIIPALLVSPFAGYLADKMSGKILALCGTSLAITSTLAFLLIKDLSWVIYGLRILQGSGHAVFFAVVFGLLAHIIPEKNRAQGIGLFAVMAQLGNSGGSFIAELIIKNFGYGFCFIGSFVIGLMAVGLMSFVKINNHTANDTSTGGLEVAKVPVGQKEIGQKSFAMDKTGTKQGGMANQESYLSAICRRNYIGGFVLILVLGGGFGTILQFVSPYLDYLHKAAFSSWRIPTSYFIPPALITVALSRVFLSRFTDRLGRKLVVLINFPLFVLIVIAITFIRSGFTALLVAIFFGLAYGFLFPALNALVLSQTEVQHRGKVSGVLVMLFDSAFFGFAFMAGPLAYHAGYFTMFYALAGVLLVGFLIYILFEEVLKPKPER